MVFTNPIMTTHMNRTIDRPSMSSMVVGGYTSSNVMNPRRGYKKPFAVTILTFYHIDGHYVRPNMVAFNILISKMMLIQMLMSKCSIL